jgi:hypothetical protein
VGSSSDSITRERVPVRARAHATMRSRWRTRTGSEICWAKRSSAAHSQTTATAPASKTSKRELIAPANCSDAPKSAPGSRWVAAQARADSRFIHVNRRTVMPDMPAIMGTTARNGPTNRPTNMLLPPLRAKYACPRSSSSGYFLSGHRLRSCS